MNIAQSMKEILKNKTYVFTDFWKEDLKIVLEEVARDFYRMASSGKKSFQNIRSNGIKISFKEVKEDLQDMLLMFKVLPKRIKDGIVYFKEDLASEIENQPDQKHKTVFCLKVLGALTSFTVGAIYQVKKGKVEFSVRGLKNRNLVTQFIFAEIVFKLLHLFMVRFLNELEAGVSETQEKENIQYFRQLLAKRNRDQEWDDHDSAIQVVENLKIYIMTGERA